MGEAVPGWIPIRPDVVQRTIHKSQKCVSEKRRINIPHWCGRDQGLAVFDMGVQIVGLPKTVLGTRDVKYPKHHEKKIQRPHY